MADNPDVLVPPSTAPADHGHDAPGQLPSFTPRERCSIFALAGFGVSMHVFFVAAFVAPGLALLSIPLMVVFFAAFWLLVVTEINEVDRAAGLLPERSQPRPRPCATADRDHFARLVRDALDELPDFLQAELPNVAVMVSDDGHTFHPSGHPLYGWYEGGTVLNDAYPSRIFIFKDTLVEDYGHDPDALRREVARTVRHELAHHLGETSERRIAELGL